MNGMRTLNDIARDARRCTRCSLHKHRHQVVFGDGPPDARVVILSDHPGPAEDRTGLPMVGEVGKFFDSCLEYVGAKRKEFFITNAVLCAPSQNHEVTPKEYAACKPWIHEIIYAIDPVLVIAMGSGALECVTGGSVAVTHQYGNVITGYIHGQLMTYEIPVGVLANPAFVFRDNDMRESGHRHKQLWGLQRLLQFADQIAHIYYGDPIPVRNQKGVDSPEYFITCPTDYTRFVDIELLSRGVNAG